MRIDAETWGYATVIETHHDGNDKPTEAVCAGNRTMMAATCEGNAAPCLQTSDYIPITAAVSII